MALLKKSLDELDRITKAAEDRRTQLREELDDLLRQKNDAQEAAEAAAQAGNVELFVEKKREAEQFDAAAYVKRAQMDNAGVVIPREAILDAWQDYTRVYNKELAREWKAFLAERKELYNHFMRLVLMQNDALHEQERCAALAGDSTLSAFKMDYLPAQNAPGVAYGGRRCTTPETVYFMSSGEADDATGDLYNSVLRVHKAF